MNKECICIVCPNSCRLLVSEAGGTITVKGNECKRGAAYGIQEYQEPVRMLTTTVTVSNGALPRLPVISSGEIPKTKINECLALLYETKTAAPVRCGDIIVKNICDTGVDVVASRSLNQKEG
jgi:CxxC motif-containing protein